jgi:RHS repeat-associated protein
MRCAYDRRGNLVSRISRNRERKYFYNAEGLLVRSEDSYGARVEFGYDAFRRRVWKRSEDAEVFYVWTGETMIAEIVKRRGAPEPEIREYLYVPGTPIPVALRAGGRVYYYHNDALGTPRRLTDDRGAIAWSADYTGFGQAVIQVRKVTNPLRFAGQYYDEETGFHYNRFRYYCPGLGRYISRDPVTFLAGLNFYTYAGNDPINSVDPQGLWDWKGMLKAAAPVLASVAVGAAIVVIGAAILPVAWVPAAIILGGVATGAMLPAFDALMQAWDGEKVCVKCTLWKMFVGGIAGGVAAGLGCLGGGVLGQAGLGAIGAAIQYTAGAQVDHSFTWHGLEVAAAAGAITSAVFEGLDLEPTRLGRPPESVHLTPASTVYGLKEGALTAGEDLSESALEKAGEGKPGQSTRK